MIARCWIFFNLFFFSKKKKTLVEIFRIEDLLTRQLLYSMMQSFFFLSEFFVVVLSYDEERNFVYQRGEALHDLRTEETQREEAT